MITDFSLMSSHCRDSHDLVAASTAAIHPHHASAYTGAGIAISVKEYKTARTAKTIIPVIDMIPLNTDFLLFIKNTPFSAWIYLLFSFDRYILTEQVCHKTDFLCPLPGFRIS